MINRCETLLKGQNIATSFKDESCDVGYDEEFIESGRMANANESQGSRLWLLMAVFGVFTYGMYLSLIHI